MLSTPALPCAIAVMAKASAPGRTKTRLTPLVTPEQAGELNTAFLKDIVANIATAARRTPMATYMAFGPPGSEPFFREHLPHDVGLIEAWQGEFGKCLFATVEALLARGHVAACVLNADSPTLPTAVITQMVEALAAPGDRAVLGPADDGGYYVLGLKTAHRRLFEDIAWSTERVGEQTLAGAAEIGLPVELLPSWYDVDDRDGLARLYRDLFEPPPVLPGRPEPSTPEHTRRLLRQMMEGGDLRQRLQQGLAGAR